MIVKPHPSTSDQSLKIFFRHFIPLILLMAFEMQDHFGKTVWMIGFVLVWVILLHMFYRVWYLLKRTPCPECGEKTTPYTTHPSLPDMHSAYCKRCDILWDLGVGNSD